MTRHLFLRFCLAALWSLLLAPVRAWSGMEPRLMKRRKVPLPITPVPEFYVEDYSGPPKNLSLDRWRLRIEGDVSHPALFTYSDLLARPSRKQFATLNCIGNPVGGHAIGNAEWEGISLGKLIETADPGFFANTLVLKGADGYHESIPLRKAFHPGALLALKMNGEPLSADHGFPLRLLIPGLYGIKQMKWVETLEIRRGSYEGYWQKQGWSREAGVKIVSRIDHPENDATLARGTVTVRGIAFAGDRGIQYVQVSTDEERTWTLARLDPPLSPWSWVFWSSTHRFSQPGRYTLAVRAADNYSGVQRDDLRDPFPSGTSGIHRIGINVV